MAIVVGSGQTSSGIIIGSGDNLTVQDGGTAVSATINSGGLAVISAGGTDSAARIDGGFLTVQGADIAATLTNSANGTVDAGGIATSATLSAHAELLIDAGGSASHTDLHSGGQLIVNGGIAVSTFVGSGGLDNVGGFGAGGTDSAATIAGGGTQTVTDGATAISATIQSGGIQSASSTGKTSQTIVNAGGIERVAGGGTAVATSIASGAAEAVGSGGIDSSTTIQSGGLEIVLSGGSAVSATVASGGMLFVLPGGDASATTVQAGGSAASTGVVLDSPAAVSAWTSSASGVSVGSSGTLYVLSGGQSISASVATGGTETVMPGGLDLSGTVSGFASATITGSAFGTTFTDDAFAFVQSGGVTTSAILINGAIEVASSGGTAIDTVLSSGGELEVDQGGSASGTTILNAANVTVSGGTISGTTAVLEGNIAVRLGGSAVDTSVGFLSQIDVASGGTASNVSLTGNFAGLEFDQGATVTGTIGIAPRSLVEIDIFGTVMPAALISGFDGPDVIDLDDIAFDPSGTISYSPGTLTVTEGGQTYALNVTPLTAYSTGTFYLSDDSFGGTDVGIIDAGSVIVSSGQTSNSIAVQSDQSIQVSAGGTVIATTLSGAASFMTYDPSPIDGGTLLVNSNSVPLALEVNRGHDSGTQIGLGGNLINLGLAESPTVSGGGILFTAGGTVHGAVVGTSGIELEDNPDSFASGSIINGGLDGVADGAVTSAVVVNSGGEQVIGGKVTIGGVVTLLPEGSAFRTTVNSGGLQFINLSGVASGTRIDADGEMVVNSGGTAFAPIIGSSGTLVLNEGAVVHSGIVFSGGSGRLDIGGVALPTTTISGFAATDVFDLKDIAPGNAPSATINTKTGMLTIAAGGTSYKLHLSGDYSAVTFEVAGDGGSGSFVAETGSVPPCYVAGTHIATPRGEIRIEQLAIGDPVQAHFAGVAPVKWIGYRRVVCRGHPDPRKVWPVRVRAGTFGDGIPHRELWLSPDHAVFVDDVLIPIKQLISGTSIAQVPMDEVTYYHIELSRHDLLLSEGLLAESYLDTGDRANFTNGSGALRLFPNFAARRDDASIVRNALACARLVVTGREIETVRQRLDVPLVRRQR